MILRDDPGREILISCDRSVSRYTPSMQHIRSSEIAFWRISLDEIVKVIMGEQSARLAEELIQWLQILDAEWTLSMDWGSS